MVVKPVDVDCMACLVTGVTTPVGWRDAAGIVHRVRWRVRGGCYRLCDFLDAGNRPHNDYEMREGAKPVDVNALIPVDEP